MSNNGLPTHLRKYGQPSTSIVVFINSTKSMCTKHNLEVCGSSEVQNN